jgi:nucleotide-binding universal stress UspA family protein
MELLRQCPCPVWLVGRHGSRNGSRIVAAVSLEWTDASTASLNTAILEWALTLKELRGAELTVLHAWTVFGGSVLRSRLPQDEFADFVAAARASAEASMSSLLKGFGGRLDGVRVELVEDEPEGAIARFVESHSVDLVVMGTVARTGIPGLVMGNTAERVLQRLRVSVLAVKPPGFVSPVAKV